MKEKEIQQYHASYTEEENKMLQEYFENASAQELVELIYELCNLYPPEKQETLKEEIQQLICEIHSRDTMKQKYDILLKCKDEMTNYNLKLEMYLHSILIREEYLKYKKNHTARYQGITLVQMFIEYYQNIDKDTLSDRTRQMVNLAKGCSEEFIRKCTFSPNSKNGINRPEKPNTIYSSLDEIPVQTKSSEETLEQLGTDNLKYLLILLLQFIDDDNNAKAAPAIMFLNRRYSNETHKKDPALFSTKLLSYEKLKEKNIELLERIKEEQDYAKTLEAEIPV